MPQTGYAAAHPDVASAGLNSFLRQDSANNDTATQHNPNIAPQHLFDTVSLPPDAYAPSALANFGLRQPSPSGNSINGNLSQLEPPQSYDALQAQNALFRTRVSELEVINDLFRGRVSQLEQAEQEARRAEGVKTTEVERQKVDLESANTKIADLEKRIAELESQATPPRKRTRRAIAEGAADIEDTQEEL